MATMAIAKIGVSFKLNNGRTICLYEGDIVKGLTYKQGFGTKTINGSVRVLNGTPKTVSNKTMCPPEPYISNLLIISSIVIDSSTEFDAELTNISISSIIDIESIEQNNGAIKVGIGNQYSSLTDVISMAAPGSTIELMNGVYTENIILDKSVKLISENGAIIKGSITVNGPVTNDENSGTITNVELNGIYLSGNSTITLNNVDSFSMTNCIFRDHEFITKTNPITIKSETPIKININGNIFGVESGFCYNLIECLGSLKDGSTFSGNTFEKGCCTHNIINIYKVEDNADIYIENNYCTVSKNMVRIGTIGDAKCTIHMDNNKYDETDILYPGLFLVQPFGTQTTNMSNVTITIDDTIKPAGIIGYYYAGTNDTQLTEDQRPIVYLEGEKIILTDLSTTN